MPMKKIPLHLRRPRGRPRRIDVTPVDPPVIEAPASVTEVPVPDPASVDAAAVLASIAADPKAPAHARVSAARALLVHRSGAGASKPTALEELNARAVALMQRRN
jgi:hypothetical protein